MNQKERIEEMRKQFGGVLKFWSEEEVELLKKLFPDTVTLELCNVFQRSRVSIYNKAKRLGLEKSENFLMEHLGRTTEKQKEIDDKIRGSNHYNYGKKRDEETIKKIKDSHFELPIEFQKLHTSNRGKGYKEFAAILDELGIEYNEQEIFLGKYLVDFYLPAYNSVIEVDGKNHSWSKKIRKSDSIRDDELHNLGLKIYRLSSDAVLEDSENVKEIVKNEFYQ